MRIVIGVVDPLRPCTPEGRDTGARQIVGVDMVGKNIICRFQHRRSLEQTFPWRTALAIRRINAGHPKNAGSHPGGTPQQTDRALRIHPPDGTLGARPDRPGFSDQIALAISIDATGGGIDQGRRKTAQSQGLNQGSGSGVVPALRGRRRQMDYAIGQASQTPQCLTLIQIAQNGLQSGSSQLGLALRRRSQGQQTRPGPKFAGNPQADIATADDQNSWATEPGW